MGRRSIVGREAPTYTFGELLVLAFIVGFGVVICFAALAIRVGATWPLS